MRGVSMGRAWRTSGKSGYLRGMSADAQISQRDLRLRAKEIIDAVESGQSFTVTRGGRQIGKFTPRRARRTFVARADFALGSVAAPAVDLAEFRADQDSVSGGPEL